MQHRTSALTRAPAACVSLVACLFLSASAGLRAAELDEFRVKREAVFEFVRKPTVTRAGDRITVDFETKGLCDVTVAIEDPNGKIVRHLASGVLGPNPPEPFQKNAKKQTVVWDGKDDLGGYIDNKDVLTVRVSLGLKAAFERTLVWSPHRRVGRNAPAIGATPEGVYVFEGSGFDHLRLFDHEGRYVRTVYPFPADQQQKVAGLKRHVFPQSGQDLPLKGGFYESTLLTSGYSGLWNDYGRSAVGAGTLAMAVRGGRIALPCLTLNRFGTDGSGGGMAFQGPATAVTVLNRQRKENRVAPRSAALAPDGRTLYLTGFLWVYNMTVSSAGPEVTADWIHGVARMDLLGDQPPTVFIGSLKTPTDTAGADNSHLDGPTSVDVDAEGRVYVADHFNDRVQVFDAQGKHLKTVPVKRPADVAIDQKTGHIYVFSWAYPGGAYNRSDRIPAVLTHFGAFDDPRQVAAYPLPLRDDYAGRVADFRAGMQYRGVLDSWRRGDDGPTIWLVAGSTSGNIYMPTQDGSRGSLARESFDRRGGRGTWERSGIILLQEKERRLREVQDFGALAAKETPVPAPPGHWRQRLYVRPTTGGLYLGEGHTFGQLLHIDPETGTRQFVSLPFVAEDLAFDLQGQAYLRTLSETVRYNPDTWKEVPFDYGQERTRVGFSWQGKEATPITSAIVWNNQSLHHQGGIWVSPKGYVVVAHLVGGQEKADIRDRDPGVTLGTLKAWTPRLFPGRGGNTVVTVWDERGKVLYEDAIPGLGFVDGVTMDRDDNLYLMSSCTRMFGNERYFDYMTGTLFTTRAGRDRVLCGSSGLRVPLASRPARPPDLADGSVGGDAWVNADWFYGGLGFTGKDGSHAMGGCNCWNYRFAFDGFARSFAPETQHYSVAVLDSSGNLLLRVGRYGNIDDGRPLNAQGGPPDTHSIGGDETAFFYPAYLATQTDRRLFVADGGNDRIVSVTLGYHTTERVALKDGAGEAR